VPAVTIVPLFPVTFMPGTTGPAPFPVAFPPAIIAPGPDPVARDPDIIRPGRNGSAVNHIVRPRRNHLRAAAGKAEKQESPGYQ